MFFRNMIYLFDVQPCWIKYTTRSKHNDGVLPSTITWTYDAGLLPYGTPQIRAWVASNRKRTLSIMNEHKSSQLSNSIDSPIMTKKHQQKSPKKEIWPKWSLPIPKWFVQKKQKDLSSNYTNSSNYHQEAIYPKKERKRSSSNHPFSGVNSLLVSGSRVLPRKFNMVHLKRDGLPSSESPFRGTSFQVPC